MRVAIDIDGVLANFTQLHTETVWRLLKKRPNWKRYDMGTTEEEFSFLYNYLVDTDLILTVKPYDGAIRTVRNWDYRRHEIYYVTSRAKSVEGNPCRVYHHQCQTYEWLETHRFPQIENLRFEHLKGEFCQRMGISILIEDKLETALNCNGLRIPNSDWAGNLHCYLLDRTWNQDPTYPRRIKSLEEVVELAYPTD